MIILWYGWCLIFRRLFRLSLRPGQCWLDPPIYRRFWFEFLSNILRLSAHSHSVTNTSHPLYYFYHWDCDKKISSVRSNWNLLTGLNNIFILSFGIISPVWSAGLRPDTQCDKPSVPDISSVNIVPLHNGLTTLQLYNEQKFRISNIKLTPSFHLLQLSPNRSSRSVSARLYEVV